MLRVPSLHARRAAILGATLLALTLSMLPAQTAHAFCGFYVSGADKKMFNDATMVVMMRQGTKTVLSMRNTYEGPPQDFAMVIPVPEVLKQADVKTLKDELFDKVDTLAAPRLVEYWEQDPCNTREYESLGGLGLRGFGRGGGGIQRSAGSGGMVKVEAEFDVDEYNVVVLSAKESNALETWLRENKYNIPQGASDVLRPYIEQGLYFFVAKVDPKKVTFDDTGKATLSPLRFSYDSKDFFLPVRLGLLNADGAQDLIIHILSREGRYEVANYKNVAIPTNLVVKPEVRERFANFYVSLFDRMIEENPGAVITEYAWDASSCDPCPTPPLNESELRSLGQDALGNANLDSDITGWRGGMGGWTLTRLHARYTAQDLKEDLVFRKATALVGGRGMPYGSQVIEDGIIGEQRATPSNFNNFQGRYIMLNQWDKPIECEAPVRGVWGGPTDGSSAAGQARGSATDTAFVDRGTFALPDVLITREIAQLNAPLAAPTPKEVPAETPPAEEVEPAEVTPEPATPTPQDTKRSSCAVSGPATPPASPLAALALLALAGMGRLRRRQR